MFQHNRPQHIHAEKNIFCMPVSVALRERVPEPHILISVSNPLHNLEFPDNRARLGLLRTYFGDVLDPTRDEANPFTTQHAHTIASFVEKYRDKVNVIAAHCSYGQSRSPAIVLSLHRWLNKGTEQVAERYPHFNRLVEKTLLAVIYDRYSNADAYHVDAQAQLSEKRQFLEDVHTCRAAASRIGGALEGNVIGGRMRIAPQDGGVALSFRVPHFEISLTVPEQGDKEGTLTLNGQALFRNGMFHPPGNELHAPLLEHHISYIPRFLATQAGLLEREDPLPQSLVPAWTDRTDAGEFLSYLGCFA